MKDTRWQLREIGSIDAFHELVQTSLEFPGHYGRNMDAFWDCLSDITRPMVVRVSGWERVPHELRAKLQPYMRMCKDYEDQTGGVFRLVFE